MVEGTGVCWQDGETARVGPGDVVVVPRGVTHATVPDEGNEMLLFCVFPLADLAGNVEELEEPLEL